LKVIEPFPQEIRERLTEIREVDLQVQSEFAEHFENGSFIKFKCF